MDDRAVPFDDRLGELLRTGDVGGFAALDLELAAELFADLPGVLAPYCGSLPPGPVAAALDYYDAPYGVAYYVARWGR